MLIEVKILHFSTPSLLINNLLIGFKYNCNYCTLPQCSVSSVLPVLPQAELKKFSEMDGGYNVFIQESFIGFAKQNQFCIKVKLQS